MNMKELDVESALFDCKFELIVQENSFDIVDKPAEQGYKFNLKWINFDHPGCEAAKLRIVRTKFRDDPLSASKQYDHITVMDSHNEVWIGEGWETLCAFQSSARCSCGNQQRLHHCMLGSGIVSDLQLYATIYDERSIARAFRD